MASEQFKNEQGASQEAERARLARELHDDITQEALRTAARHAKATQVEITIRPLDDGLQLSVRDDGRGFDPRGERVRPSLGLAGMLQRALVEAAKRWKPDVIVADIGMPHFNGLDTLAVLKRENPRVRVVFLTMHQEVAYARRAIESGAAGYVLKHSVPAELVTALRAALAGQTYITPALAGAVFQSLRLDKDTPADPASRPSLSAWARPGTAIMLNPTPIELAAAPAPAPLSCVLLADRHHGLSEGLRGLLATMFDAVAMVADEASLLECAGRIRPPVAVVDLSLVRDESTRWLERLRQRCPEMNIVALSIHDEPAVRRAALAAGADAVVLKHSLATELLPAIAAVQSARASKPSSPESPE